MRILISFIFLVFMYAVSIAQNAGIGSTLPQRNLHLSSGTFLVTGDTGTAPSLGAGPKFLWVSAKSALRAGYTNASGIWNHSNLGQYSFAFGSQSNATGNYGFAGGNASFANGENSIAIGNSVIANGTGAVAIGRNIIADSYGSFAVGRFAEANGNSAKWVETDPLFVVGNGYFQTDPFPIAINRNALTVLKNGNMIIGGSVTGSNGRLEVGGKEVQLPKQAYSVQTGSTLNLIPIGVVIFTASSVGTSIKNEEQQQFPSNLLSAAYSNAPTNERLDITFEFNNAMLTGYRKIFAEIAFGEWGYNCALEGIQTDFSNGAVSGSESELLMVPVIAGNIHRLRTIARWTNACSKKLTGSFRLYGIK